MLTYKDLEIEHIVNKKLKHSYISVDKKGHVKVKTPTDSQKHLENLLQEKEQWLTKHLQIIRENKPREIDTQKELFLFGEIISLDDALCFTLKQKLQKIKNSDALKIEKLYNEFYKLIAQDYLTNQVNHYSQLMGLKYKQLKFRKMKSRWGSCSSQKIITLNTQLLKLNKTLIDYVIIHELSHLVHMNHSKEFYNLVQIYNPDFKTNIKKLKNVILDN